MTKSKWKKLDAIVFILLFLFFEVFGVFLLFGNPKNNLIALLRDANNKFVNLSYETGLLFYWIGSYFLDTIIWGILGQTLIFLFFLFMYKLLKLLVIKFLSKINYLRKNIGE
ncbi:MAG: hypothetical protein K9H61_14545 [Bacteroidia bacterium]|nr:hypothetical protein [Bacteroidia bacterium]MCF8428029.1 hypothetical protein [Bacteroidia bacterium]MCF8448207.1 hypothetical protein [Bacteroidia bacterium]